MDFSYKPHPAMQCAMWIETRNKSPVYRQIILCKQLNAGISVAIYWGGIHVQARRDGAEGVSSEDQHPSNRETGYSKVRKDAFCY